MNKIAQQKSVGLSSRFTLPLCAIAMLTLTGCATLFGHPSQIVMFESDPKGMDVYVDGAFVGVTPVGVNLMFDGSKRELLIEEGDENITQEMLDENKYSILYKQPSRQDIKFFVKSSYDSDIMLDEKNYYLCSLDMGLAFLTFGVTILVDKRYNACNHFDKKYIRSAKNIGANSFGKSGIIGGGIS